ncbi:MAG: hypothetical protein E6I06_15790 [Chloroflexi bacterium]|nr:MAG: hypothetical protein E6I06_15790 [Chloroflexota bacterium]
MSSSQLVLASQRVQYNQSFNEQPAQTASEAVGAGFFNWYDRASPGMGGDNIHVFNPGTGAASVTVSVPGAKAITLSVGSGAESYVSFPTGTIAGPVTVSSSAPILAWQRVQYYQTFNEICAG